ncbi:MAG: type II toxin-antitoxin system RelE/ParE family toxin [Lachnospiraceae bacterium]|nr:type II toxin-antitoxin system RelE/ParE family toxin [Lachnospiraceae bacterium]
MQTVDEVRFSKEARNFLKKADAKLKSQIKEGIEGLKTIPSTGNIKPMEGYKDGRMRLRIGKYRVIYRYENSSLLVLYIIDIGARGDIYK